LHNWDALGCAGPAPDQHLPAERVAGAGSALGRQM